MRILKISLLMIVGFGASACGQPTPLNQTPYSPNSPNSFNNYGNVGPAGLTGNWRVVGVTCNGMTPYQAQAAFMSPNSTTYFFSGDTFTRTDVRSTCSQISTYKILNNSGSQFTGQQSIASTFNPPSCAQYWTASTFNASAAPTESYTYSISGMNLIMTGSNQDCSSIGGQGQIQYTLMRQ